jgi:hypothetical protein
MRLAAALKLTSGPPATWIKAAVMIPSTTGDLDRIEQAVASAEFRKRFAVDPLDAVSQAGLEPSDRFVAALRERLA